MQTSSVTAAILLLLCATSSLLAGEKAQLIVQGANILTMEDPSRAGSFAIRDGHFIAVGTNEALNDLRGPETEILDLSDKTIVPGFNDAHIHPRAIHEPDSPWTSVELNPSKVATMDELIAALRRKAERTPEGHWVTGSRYQDTKLGRHPTRQDLDRASERHPIIISHSSGHVSACNSLALKLAGVTRETPDPKGGRFVRDEQGEATGLLQEGAASIVRDAGPERPVAPTAETLAAYRRCYRQFITNGLTSIQAAGVSLRSAEQLIAARTENESIRLYLMLRDSDRETAAMRLREQGSSSDEVRFGAIKLFHGNSLSGQTCWLSKPYANRPDYFGIPPARSQTELNKLVLAVHTAGLQACVHSNGDREIDMLLTAFEEALTQHPRDDHRHRIEHCSVVTPEILDRIKKLGIVIAPHSYLSEHGDKLEQYGAERWEWMLPARSALGRGIPIAGNSDYPVSNCRPLQQIEDMVTRRSTEGKVYGASQQITAAEAVHAWTLGSAFASFEENRKGSIKAGKLADFVVLSADPTMVPPEQISDIQVEATYIGGLKVFDRSAEMESSAERRGD